MTHMQEKENFCRFANLVTDIASRILKNKLKCCFSNSSIEQILNVHQHEIYHLWHTGNCCKCSPIKEYSGSARRKRVIYDGQWDSLFDRCTSSSATKCGRNCCCCFQAKSVEDIDVSISSCLLLNISSLTTGEKQLVTEIRDLRNTVFGHSSNASLSNPHFDDCWRRMSRHLNNLAKTCSAGFHMQMQEEIEKIKTKVLDPSFVENITKIAQELKMDPTILSDLSDIKSKRADVLRLIEETERRLRAHKTQYFPQVRQEQTALYHIHRRRHEESENKSSKLPRTLVISGRGGSGKTSFGEEILFQLLNPASTDNERYTPIIVTDPSEWKLALSEHGSVAILVDDPFGKTNYDNSKLEQWDQCFRELRAEKDAGNNLCIIMCIRDNILRECKSKLEIYDVFYDDTVVDLSSNEFTLTFFEKKQLLKQYCEFNKITIFEGTKNQHPVTGTLMDVDGNLKISKSTIHEIAKSDPFIGFHQSCYLFFKNKKFFKLGLDFFAHANQEIINEVDKLSADDVPLSYCILVYALLRGGKFDTASMKNDNLLQDLFTLFNIPHKSHAAIDSFIRHKIEAFYLTSSGNHYEFKHQTILEAVLLSFGKSYPENFLQLASDSVVCEFARSSGYRGNPGEICINLPATTNELLAEKLASIYGIAEIAKHETTTDDLFLEILLKKSEKYLFMEDDKKEVFHFSSHVFCGERKHQIHVLKWLPSKRRYNVISELESNDPYDKGVIKAIKYDRRSLVVKMLKRFMKPETESTPVINQTDGSDENGQNEKKTLGIATYIHSLNYLLSKREKKMADNVQKMCGIRIDRAVDILADRMASHYYSNDVITYLADQRWKEILLCLTDAQLCTFHNTNHTGDIPLIEYCFDNDWDDVLERFMTINKDAHSYFNSQKLSLIKTAAKHKAKKILHHLIKQNKLDVTVQYGHYYLIEWCCKYDWVDVLQDIVEINPEVLTLPNCSYSKQIIHAAGFRSKLVTLYLLEKNVDHKVHDENGVSFIQHCVKNGWDDIFHNVVEICPEVLCQPNLSPSNLIVFAARCLRKEMVLQMLKKGVDPTVSDSDGKNLMYYCCRNNWNDVLQKIIQINPEVLNQPNCSYNKLMMFTARFRNRSTILYFLEKDVDLCTPDDEDNYMLGICCSHDWVDVFNRIVEMNPDVLSQPNCSYAELIVKAAKSRSRKIVSSLLEKDIDLTVPDTNGQYLIQYCCKHDWVDVLQRIVELNHMVLDQPNCSYESLVVYAAKYESELVVSYLLQIDVGLSAPDSENMYLVHYCCMNGWLDILKRVIEMNPEVLDRKNCSYLDLLYYAAKAHEESIVLYLLTKNVDLSVPSIDGKYMVHYCCENNWFDVLQKVVEIYPDVLNRPYCSYSHLVIYAAKVEQYDAVLHLLRNEVDITLPDIHKKFFIHYCCQNGWTEILHQLGKIDINILELLDSEKETPIMVAAKCGKKESVSYLLRRNVDIGRTDNEGKCVLHYCCEYNWPNILEKIDPDHALLNHRDYFNSTPIVHAAKNKNKRAVECLLAKNVDIMTPDVHGNMLVQYCLENDWTDLAFKLLSLME